SDDGHQRPHHGVGLRQKTSRGATGGDPAERAGDRSLSGTKGDGEVNDGNVRITECRYVLWSQPGAEQGFLECGPGRDRDTVGLERCWQDDHHENDLWPG